MLPIARSQVVACVVKTQPRILRCGALLLWQVATRRFTNISVKPRAIRSTVRSSRIKTHDPERPAQELTLGGTISAMDATIPGRRKASRKSIAKRDSDPKDALVTSSVLTPQTAPSIEGPAEQHHSQAGEWLAKDWSCRSSISTRSGFSLPKEAVQSTLASSPQPDQELPVEGEFTRTACKSPRPVSRVLPTHDATIPTGIQNPATRI